MSSIRVNPFFSSIKLISYIQIPIRQKLELFRKKHHDEKPRHDERAESDLAFPGFCLHPNQHEARDRPDHISEKKDEEDFRPAGNGSGQKPKLHVSSADPFSARYPDEKKEKTGSGERRQKRASEGIFEIGNPERTLKILPVLEKERDDDGWKNRRVGNEHETQVMEKNENEVTRSEKPKSHFHHVVSSENFLGGKTPPSQKLPGHGRIKDARQKFDSRILPGNFLFALAAFSPKDDEAQKRHVIIPADLFFAMRAMGALENDVLGNLEPVVHGSEKRSDNEAY